MAPSPFTGLLPFLLPLSVSAALPFNSKISEPVLKHSNEVSFDPLGVAAILYNPRAENSAARLYTQPDRAIFRWPHTMMIGGALTPLSVLVAYLTSKVSSIDPAVSMCLTARINLPVRSTMVFPDIPIFLSNAWLRDILAFKPSHYPENDFAVAEVKDSFVQPTSNLTPLPKTRPSPLTILDLLDLLCGLLIITGVVFSVLAGDVWAITLFFIYMLHWLASTIISFNPLVKLQQNNIVPDASIQYAVYQRPEGGTVVFMGQKDTLERWARMTWKFDSRLQNHFLHWFWIVTGTLAAVASVACMVNMVAYLQLGFLGVLVYSSVAEILATQVARKLQARARGGPVASGKAASSYNQLTFVWENKTRTKGIIRATLQCQLDGQMWFKLKLLPQTAVFERMLVLLDELKTVEDEQRMKMATAAFRAEFRPVGGEKDVSKLAERIAEEAEEAWKELRVKMPV